jgi:integrase
MASVSNEQGRRAIQFVGTDDRRHTIRLGKCDQRTAEGVKLHLERLAVAKKTGMPIHVDTVNWLSSIDDELHARIAANGLTERRLSPTKDVLVLGKMVDAYIGRRESDMKAWSITTLKQARDKLVKFYGADKPVSEITVADALDFKRNLSAKHSAAYVAKIVLRARQFFKDAVDGELIGKSPFSKIKPGTQKNPQRLRFISRAIIDKAIEHAPDLEWKLIIAFARYGGVRIPSEILALRWNDVLWDQSKVLIRASKTEHHVGKESRLIPLFPELKNLLLRAFEQAEEGAVYVITRYRSPSVNLRTQFLRILAKAGIEPWPKLFQNLRSSRQTELTESWPAHVVCAWIGNSEVVARDHYLQITDEHFTKAAGTLDDSSAAESGAASARFTSQGVAPLLEEKSPSPEIAESNDAKREDAKLCDNESVGGTGLEPVTPSVSCWCASQLRQPPGYFGCYPHLRRSSSQCLPDVA